MKLLGGNNGSTLIQKLSKHFYKTQITIKFNPIYDSNKNLITYRLGLFLLTQYDARDRRNTKCIKTILFLN